MCACPVLSLKERRVVSAPAADKRRGENCIGRRLFLRDELLRSPAAAHFGKSRHESATRRPRRCRRLFMCCGASLFLKNGRHGFLYKNSPSLCFSFFYVIKTNLWHFLAMFPKRWTGHTCKCSQLCRLLLDFNSFVLICIVFASYMTPPERLSVNISKEYIYLKTLCYSYNRITLVLAQQTLTGAVMEREVCSFLLSLLHRHV